MPAVAFLAHVLTFLPHILKGFAQHFNKRTGRCFAKRRRLPGGCFSRDLGRQRRKNTMQLRNLNRPSVRVAGCAQAPTANRSQDRALVSPGRKRGGLKIWW